MPGPMIEDPPGPYQGHSHVRAPGADLKVATEALSTFIVTYNGFTPQAQAAFQAAVDVWASQFQSFVPIRVTANWTVLGSNVLGSAGPVTAHRNFPGAPIAGTWFPAAIADRLSGSDLAPSSGDIVANFNSNFTWYYGADGNAGTNFDLMSVALHELGHGLGFVGSMTVSGGNGSWGLGSTSPYIYDRFAVNSVPQALLDTSLFPNPSSALAAQLTSNSIFFAGANARSGNGGALVRLYAPNPWQSGSSYSHLNESTFPAGNPNSLMTPSLGPGESIHDPGNIVRGAFNDMGSAAQVASPPSRPSGVRVVQ